MIEERELASKLGHEDPINESYEKTGDMYRACAEHVLPGIKDGDWKFMFATHNEETVQHIAQRFEFFNKSNSKFLISNFKLEYLTSL